MCKVIAVSNQKGGVGKTVSCVNLGIGLAQEGKKVLLIDGDPQGSLTISLGYEEPDEMEYSLATLMMNIVNDEKLNIEKTILHHKEGVDLIPANIELSAIEVSLVNAISRELILKSMVEKLRDFYDFIIIDCMPSLGMMTINALACADSVLIPVQAAYLPVKGLQQLIKTIGRVKKQLNPKLKIEGILLTMVDNRTNYARDHCHYNIGDRVPIVAGRLDNLETRIDDLLEEWTQTLLNTISDPIVSSQKGYLSAEQQKAVENFVSSGTLPKRVDDFFVKAIKALLQGFEPVVINTADLTEKLEQLSPMDEASFKQKLNEIVAAYTQGKDTSKIRIVVKR